MTDVEWLTATDSLPMLEYLKGKASDRKLRLFTVACCRAIWEGITYQRSRQTIELAEQYADGLVDDHALTRANSLAMDAVSRYQTVNGRKRLSNNDGPNYVERRLVLAANTAHVNKPFRIGRLRTINYDPVLKTISPNLLREIMGPTPSQPIPMDQQWLTSNVVTLATIIYDRRDYSPMPILADALQDAGCDNEEMLKHCREPGEHVRGCWVIDSILGKS